ncbi:hypothetical protein AAC978_01170 [Desulfitobacterium sp. THU1]|uniref:hypothetical protein n=1 Tax=Desulfitobacterium sp. THU1 TaxID=3138072 RepID=UPI00311DE1F9
MTLDALHQSDQLKEDQLKDDLKVNHSFQVVCSECHRTIIFSGKGGEVHFITCDQCEGL